MDMSLCYNCFKEFDGGGVCPHCGYDAAAEDGKHSLALRPGTILDGRYIVGRVLGQGGFGISYLAQIGMDICQDCGEHAIRSAIEICCRLCLTALSLPLFQALAATILEVIG